MDMMGKERETGVHEMPVCIPQQQKPKTKLLRCRHISGESVQRIKEDIRHGLSGKKVDQKKTYERESKNDRICPLERGGYSRLRTIAERRQMKPERSMQTSVAITVTKVPLSVAEWGPPLQAPHCQPYEATN